MKQDIKKLFKSIVILSAAFILIDVLVGYLGEIALKKLPDFGNELCKVNYRLNRIKTNVIIVGSSRAQHHYNTKILADSVNSYLGTNYSFYNAGIGGYFVDCNACTIESILNRHKPQLIIWEINKLELNNTNWQKSLQRYEAFYKINHIVKDYLDRLGWNEKLRVAINMHRFNSKTISIIGDIRYPQKADTGYSPVNRIMNLTDSKNKKDDSYNNNNNNHLSINNLTRAIKLCASTDVKLIIASSPRYKPLENNDIIDSLCDKYHIPHIDFYNTIYFNEHPELFYDKNHLNNNGATLYTKLFFEALKPYLN